MLDSAVREEFSVLLFDENPTRLELFDDWLDGVATTLVSQPTDLGEALERRTTVACLSAELVGDRAEAYRKLVLTNSPFCQLVLLLPRDSFITAAENDYDGWLRRPVFKEDLRELVERRLLCGTYARTLKEFYELNAKLTGRSEDASADGAVPDEADSLQGRYRVVRRRLRDLRRQLRPADLSSTRQSLQLHRRYLREQPATTETDGGASKYHPGKCPQCHLPWGIHHRNELGKGFQAVGAYVWKCTRCNEMVHGPGASHRRVSGL